MAKEKENYLAGYVVQYRKLTALFSEDMDLLISPLDDETKSCVITTANYHKAQALKKFLSAEINEELGRYLKVEINYTGIDHKMCNWLNDLFEGNPHFSRTRVAVDAMSGKETPLCLFKDETIQYAADSRFVPYGYETTLAEKLVQDLFKPEMLGMSYITEEKSGFAVVDFPEAQTDEDYYKY